MRIIAAANAPQNKLAAKYCFKATAHLKTVANGRLLASFTAYDKSPEVAAAVQRTCESMRADNQPPSDVVCSVVELLLYETCPTECDGEVSTVVH